MISQLAVPVVRNIQLAQHQKVSAQPCAHNAILSILVLKSMLILQAVLKSLKKKFANIKPAAPKKSK